MTTLTIPGFGVSPTRFERALRVLATHLSGIADARMQRRLAVAGRTDLRADAREVQRDVAAAMRSGILPR